jgi:hypothetical protein
MHQSFGKSEIMTKKVSGSSETLVSEVYAGCSEPGHVHTRDE